MNTIEQHRDKLKIVLLATTNKDKYNAVKKILESTIFKKESYKIESLKTLNIKLNTEEEQGDNINRAIEKALIAYNQLKDYNFEYIVGLDDAIRIKGKTDPNIKKLLNKILYEHLLDEGEEFSFQRAYAFINKDGKVFSTIGEIPYIYKSNKDVLIKENSYPLSYVSYPIGYDKPINMLDEKEELEYYLKYVSKAIEQLQL